MGYFLGPGSLPGRGVNVLQFAVSVTGTDCGVVVVATVALSEETN